MKPRHVAALVIGCLLLVPGLGMLIGGGAVGAYELAARDDGGWHYVDINRMHSAGVAVTTRDTMVELKAPSAVVNWLDLEMSLRATPTQGSGPIFIGVAPAADLSSYLGTAPRDEITRLDVYGVPTYRTVGSTGTIASPTSQSFWAAKSTGPGTQELRWTVSSGTWAIAVLNASGEPGVSVSAQAGVRAGALLPVAFGLIGTGLVLLALAIILIVVGIRGRREAGPPPGAPLGYAASASPAGAWGPPVGSPVGSSAAGVPDDRTSAFTDVAAPHVHPVVLEARLAPDLSRWFWLVKWFLAIPHFFALFFLWIGLGVSTFCAWFAILFTGRYPRSLFDYNVGVMRWTWRVSHYCGTGGLGTDRYPPMTLDPMPDDDARLTVDYPVELSRGLIFVKWFLLLPHWIVIALIAGTQSRRDANGVQVGGWPGILGLLTFVAGVILLVNGSPSRSLFDIIVGLNRWVFRVMAYAALMTDVYPPFRYDGGAMEPAPPAPPSGGSPTYQSGPDVRQPV